MIRSIQSSLILTAAVVITLVGCAQVQHEAAQPASAQLKPAMEAKVGDELYVCNCGEKCPCDTLSRKAGKCTCGVDLVKATVTAVGDGEITVDLNGKDRAFKAAGKYACACGLQCPCNTISQNPGKCVCGVEMKPVS